MLYVCVRGFSICNKNNVLCTTNIDDANSCIMFTLGRHLLVDLCALAAFIDYLHMRFCVVGEPFPMPDSADWCAHIFVRLSVGGEATCIYQIDCLLAFWLAF